VLQPGVLLLSLVEPQFGRHFRFWRSLRAFGVLTHTLSLKRAISPKATWFYALNLGSIIYVSTFANLSWIAQIARPRAKKFRPDAWASACIPLIHLILICVKQRRKTPVPLISAQGIGYHDRVVIVLGNRDTSEDMRRDKVLEWPEKTFNALTERRSVRVGVAESLEHVRVGETTSSAQPTLSLSELVLSHTRRWQVRHWGERNAPHLDHRPRTITKAASRRLQRSERCHTPAVL